MTVKRCNECRHSFDPDNASIRCEHPKVAGQNKFVLGGISKGTSTVCERERWSPFAPCGRAGKLWEPREGKE